jgi:hypothetical protein
MGGTILHIRSEQADVLMKIQNARAGGPLIGPQIGAHKTGLCSVHRGFIAMSGCLPQWHKSPMDWSSTESRTGD